VGTVLRPSALPLVLTRRRRASIVLPMVEETIVECPYCGEPASLDVDTSVAEQSYYEDCPVCCRPMEVFVRARPGEILSISVSSD
jgi:hypothetical protein